jgi:hypothetical protein
MLYPGIPVPEGWRIATTSASRTAPARRRPQFFARTGWIMLALVVASFPLTYYGPLLTGTTHFRALRHVHGVSLFGWMILYAWQAQLVARGQTARHREIGLFGLLLVGTIAVLGPWMAFAAGAERAAAGSVRPWEFTLYNLVDIANFAGFSLAAIATVTRRIAWHRRFMYTAAVNLVGPAFSRWTLKLPAEWPLLDMGPNLFADLFLLALAMHDRKTAGRVHRATSIAIALTVPIHVVSPWIARSDAWNILAPWLFG